MLTLFLAIAAQSPRSRIRLPYLICQVSPQYLFAFMTKIDYIFTQYLTNLVTLIFMECCCHKLICCFFIYTHVFCCVYFF